MTRIERPVRRETNRTVRDRGTPRQVCVELEGGYLTVWAKGTQQRVSVSYDAIWDLGWKLRARAERAEKRLQKGAH